MKKKFWKLGFTVILALSACQPAQETPTHLDEKEVPTEVATEVIEATATPLPSTATALQPTATPVPPSPTSTVSPTATELPIPTITPIVVFSPTKMNLPPHYDGKEALLKIENRTGKRVTVYLTGVTYYEFKFTSDFIRIEDAPWGDYSYTVYIDEEGPYTGSFLISNKDKHTLVIEKNKVHFVGP